MRYVCVKKGGRKCVFHPRESVCHLLAAEPFVHDRDIVGVENRVARTAQFLEDHHELRAAAAAATICLQFCWRTADQHATMCRCCFFFGISAPNLPTLPCVCGAGGPHKARNTIQLDDTMANVSNIGSETRNSSCLRVFGQINRFFDSEPNVSRVLFSRQNWPISLAQGGGKKRLQNNETRSKTVRMPPFNGARELVFGVLGGRK